MAKEDFQFIEENWYTPNTYDANFKEPPTTPGIYLLVLFDLKTGGKEILYVGSAKNLSQRYGRHEVLRTLKIIYEYVRFYFKECEDYKTEEIKMIKLIRPKFNKQFNK